MTSGREPIALVGIGCRFPGGADGPLGYWRLLRDAVDAVGEAPPERWGADALYDPDPSKPGKSMSKWGGYLDRVDSFDWRAFRISPREAKFMDPQHRLLLEVSWEALEDAGVPTESVAGSRTAVVVGIMWNDYAKLAARDYTKLEGYNANGNSFAYAANRISYFFDLKGPSLAVDVQCASSLTAVHLACQSIWAGEVDAALAGGVNLIISADTNIAMSKASILSPDGRVKAWDASANGFVRGEGAGVVLLKPLARAVADGDRVYAVIRSSVVTHGGKTDWIMAPSREAQEDMLRRAYAEAGIEPSSVDYLELHGTGTKVGDPIEAAAVGAVLGRPDRPLRVGSVKTQIGHLDSAAGMAGLIKAALAVHRREIPASLHFTELNPAIPADELGVAVQAELGPWPQTDEPVAGVTGLSFGGGHAHIVLSGPPAADGASGRPPARPYLLPLSAKSDDALRELAGRYARFLADDPSVSLLDVCHTAGARRSHHDHRAAVVARSREELVEKLDALARGEVRGGVTHGVRRGEVRPVFVFSGQGRPWWGSGRELLALEPVFRRAVAACDSRIRPHARWSLLDELTRTPEESRLDRVAFAQPATFALQMGLLDLWRSFGVQPAAVIGHSVGEVAGAVAAGAVSPADAARLVVYRGQLMKNAPTHPAMAAVLLPQAEVTALIEPYGHALAVAADNAPSATLVSGEADAIERFVARCEADGVYATALPEHDVFHRAPHAFGDALASWLGEWSVEEPSVPFFSTAGGGPLDAGYWGAQLSKRVEFRSAVEAALDEGFDCFVELAAHPVLAGPVGECLRGRDAEGVVVSSLRRGEREQDTVLDALGALYVRGLDLDWPAVQPGPGRVVSLPTHPWLGERMWIDVGEVSSGAVGAAVSGHPLLGTHVEIADGGRHVWESVIDRRRVRHLDDHLVQGVAILAGAGYVDMVVSAVDEAFGWTTCTLREISLRKALVLPDDGSRRVQLVITDDGDFRVLSRAGADDPWVLHVTGRVSEGAAPADALDPDVVQAGLPQEVSGGACYRRFEDQGEHYGPTYQGIASLWRRDHEVLARMRAPAGIVAELPLHRFHPALLDACMHALVMASPEEGGEGGFMPTSIDEIRVYGRLDSSGWSHVRLATHDDLPTGQECADITVAGDDGTVAMAIRALRLQYLDESALQAPLSERWYHSVDWQPRGEPGRSDERRRWAIVGDSTGVADALARRLSAEGDVVVDLDSADADADGVVHLASLGSPPLDAITLEELLEVQGRGCGGAMALVQSVKARLYLVTQDAWGTGAAQASLWGFGRSLAQERPELWGGLVDLDGSFSAEEAAEALVRHLRSIDGEDQVQLRADGDRVARLVRERVPAVSRPAVTWRTDAAYLVTGGLGDLGLAVAQWMVSQGARRLVLMGRTPLPPRSTWPSDDSPRVAAVRALEAAGAEVHVAAVDIGDEAGVRAWLEQWEADARPPIRGVVHAAGIAPFEAVEQMTLEGVQGVLRPKVAGSWVLHHVFADRPLDFLVLYSSASAVLSSPRLAHYAAGNAFLDAFASWRVAQGLPCHSIVWGPWAEVGMATRTGAGGPASLRGMSLIPLEEGMDAMNRIMATDRAVTAVLPIEWAEWGEAYAAAAGAPILREVLVDRTPAAPGTDEDAAPGNALDDLLDLPAEERASVVAAKAVEQVSSVLRVAPEQLAGDQSLAELGFDSLMAMELRARLASTLGVDLSILEILGATTATQLGAVLAGRVKDLAAMPMEPRAPATVVEVGRTDVEWVVDQLSDDDVEAMLAELEGVS